MRKTNTFEIVLTYNRKIIERSKIDTCTLNTQIHEVTDINDNMIRKQPYSAQCGDFTQMWKRLAMSSSFISLSGGCL
jgi:hypothetical protein